VRQAPQSRLRHPPVPQSEDLMHRRAVSITRDDGDQLGEVALVIGEISVDPADGEAEAANLGALTACSGVWC
jgi:hypothetical protein